MGQYIDGGWCLKLRGRTEESDSLSSVEETMVVGESDNHDRSDNDLAVNNDRLLLDGVHAYNKRVSFRRCKKTRK